MPITQQRLLDLVTESENLIAAIKTLLANAETIRGSALGDADKFQALLGELWMLRDLPTVYTFMERRDLNRNWRRNERTAAKLMRKRRAAGVQPRTSGPGPAAPSVSLRGQLRQGLLDHATGTANVPTPEDDEYERWNRGETI